MTDPRPTTRKGRQKGPECGATNRNGEPCQRPAGWGTDHPGEGRCKLHGGVGQIKGTQLDPVARYSDLQARPRLRELVAQFAQDANPDDLSHELTLLRALVTDFIERHDDITEALLAWHASFTDGYVEAVKLWREKLADWAEEQDQGMESNPPPMPIPTDFMNKPRQLVDITAAAGLIDRIGSMSDRIAKRKREGVISMDVLDKVLQEFGREVVAACQEVGLNELDRTHLLRAVERRWRDIRIDPAAASARATGSGKSLN